MSLTRAVVLSHNSGHPKLTISIKCDVSQFRMSIATQTSHPGAASRARVSQRHSVLFLKEEYSKRWVSTWHGMSMNDTVHEEKVE